GPKPRLSSARNFAVSRADATKFEVNLPASANWHEFCFSLFEPVFPAQPRLKPPFDGDIRCS
ncbi:hypothetical protein, partial [Tritonibacter sp. SIMBA_163]|uniref:hypothetical protein n=1 Tax=Tritonibacter sp. SIMBA_163 TaxID=3080868 RepID=UPI00397FFA33